jgi:hypothetical protein
MIAQPLVARTAPNALPAQFAGLFCPRERKFARAFFLKII